MVRRVLNAAALTYVAATITAILTLLYWLMRSGLLGGRRDSQPEKSQYLMVTCTCTIICT